MRKIGIVCEYNPFHNGHLYHLSVIKKMYPESLIVLVLSGYFTERGDVSLISKYNKTKIALQYGVDIVLELPTLYTLNSADFFANFSVNILNELKVEKIVFGSETNDINLLKTDATKQNNIEFQYKVRNLLSNGMNYPSALSTILKSKYSSNDLLAISYIKAIIQNKFDIDPITIKRTNSFKDLSANENIVSAENIRNKLENNQNITKYIPKYNKKYINKINQNKLFELLKYKLLTTSDLSDYLGVDEGIEFKIKKELDKARDLNDLILKIKSKRYTYVRIKRMLMHILIGIKKEDIQEKNQYIRILGFSSLGQKFLKDVNNKHLVYKYNNRVREIEIISAKVYYMLTKDKSVFEEFLNKPVIKK